MPMEATHILLGRPWQFDRKVFYDGHANTYAFSFQGKKFTLLPLSPNQANEEQNKVKDKIKDEKEKEQVTSKVLLASKKRFPKIDGHHHSSFSCKTQKEDPMRKHERKSGLEKRDGLPKLGVVPLERMEQDLIKGRRKTSPKSSQAPSTKT